MKNVNFLILLGICLCLLNILGCNLDYSEAEARPEIINRMEDDDILHEISKIDFSHLRNLNVSIRTRDFNDDRVIVSSDSIEGYILLKINEECDVFSETINDWKGSKLNFESRSLITILLCDNELNGVSVDQSGNVYIALRKMADYDYVLVANETTLDDRVEYKKLFDNWYKIK